MTSTFKILKCNPVNECLAGAEVDDEVVVEITNMPDIVFALFTHNLAQMIRTIRDKNQDYADYKGGGDFFKNFRGGGLKGIVNRMGDKLLRLAHLLKSGVAAVKDESFEDTCLDLANYSLILLEAYKARLTVDGELWQDEIVHEECTAEDFMDTTKDAVNRFKGVGREFKEGLPLIDMPVKTINL